MTDLDLARLSNDLLFGAVVLYSLAMLGFAAEFSFGRRTGTLAAPSTAPDDGSRRARRVAARRAAGHTPAGAIGKLAVALTFVGWATHVGSVVTRGLAGHRVPWGNMYEFAVMISLTAVTAFLVLLNRQGVRSLGAFVLAPVVLYLGVAGTILYTDVAPLVPALNSYWLKIHTTAAIGSSGVFIVAAAVSAVYLVKARWESQQVAVSMGPGAASTMELAPVRGITPQSSRRGGIMRQLPSAAALDRTAYRLIAFAFPIWTFAIMAGAVWAEAAWGRYWGWDPKETWSFITWVVYAGYLHSRATAGWKGSRAAKVSLVAFACLTVDFICVNIWITGLHSYAGV